MSFVAFPSYCLIMNLAKEAKKSDGMKYGKCRKKLKKKKEKAETKEWKKIEINCGKHRALSSSKYLLFE